MNDEPDIEYEAPPAVVELDGNEQEADAATLAGACARLRLYTSQPYLAEAGALFGEAADAFVHWPRARERFGTQTAAAWSDALREQRAALERGLALLDAGYTAAAYASIAEALRDGLEPADPRDDRHFSLRLLAEEIGDPLNAIAGTLGHLADRIWTTLNARWTYQTLLHYALAHEEASAPSLCGRGTGAKRQEEGSAFDAIAPMSDPPEIASGNSVPKTGLWLPITIRYGCPNFLIAGRMAPLLLRAGTRYDYEASDGGGLEPPQPAWSAFDYIEEPTVWRMVWYDTRYRAGIGRTE